MTESSHSTRTKPSWSVRSGREVGRIRATAENAEAYLIDLAIRYRRCRWTMSLTRRTDCLPCYMAANADE